MSGATPNSQEPTPAKPHTKDGSSAILGVFIVVALGLVATVLWVVFGEPASQRPGSNAQKKDGATLTKEQFTVIAADDDETSKDSEREAAGETKSDGESQRESGEKQPSLRERIESERTREGDEASQRSKDQGQHR